MVTKYVDYETYEKMRGVFSDWLKNELVKRKISQREFARISGISKSQVFRYINWGEMPNFMYAIKIAYALDIPVENVFILTDNDMAEYDKFVDGIRQKLNLNEAQLQVTLKDAIKLFNM